MSEVVHRIYIANARPCLNRCRLPGILVLCIRICHLFFKYSEIVMYKVEHRIPWDLHNK